MPSSPLPWSFVQLGYEKHSNMIKNAFIEVRVHRLNASFALGWRPDGWRGNLELMCCTSRQTNVVEESMHGHTGSSEADVTWRALLLIADSSQFNLIVGLMCSTGWLPCAQPCQVGNSWEPFHSKNEFEKARRMPKLRVSSIWKSLGRENFGSKSLGPIFLYVFLLNWTILRK